MEAIQGITAVCQAVEYICKYVDGCVSFSKQAKNLRINLKIDLAWLEKLDKYLQNLCGGQHPDSIAFNQLRQPDQDLILAIRQHIMSIKQRAEKVQYNIRTGQRSQMARLVWAFVRSDVMALADEISDWRQRLGIVTMRLPDEIATTIDFWPSPSNTMSSAMSPPGYSNSWPVQPPDPGPVLPLTAATAAMSIVNTNHFQTGTPPTGLPPPWTSTSNPAVTSPYQIRSRLRRFNAREPVEKLYLAQSLHINLKDPEIRIHSTHPQNLPRTFAQFNDIPVLIEHKQYDPIVVKNQFNSVSNDLRDRVSLLAAELSNVDPITTSLLQCIGWYDDNRTYRLGRIFRVPFTININEPVRTLKDLLLSENKSSDGKIRPIPVRHTLDQRFVFARKIVTGLCYFHSFEWVHKDITSANIVVLDHFDPDDTKEDAKYSGFPYKLGHPYIMSFDRAREEMDFSDLRDLKEDWALQANIYRHPDRQYGSPTPCKHTTRHDLYSLGVVLLELGLWQALGEGRYGHKLKKLRGRQQTAGLVELARKELPIIVGKRYSEAVVQCLSDNIDGDESGAIARCLSGILEDMADLAASSS
ncbi:hypothetical protein ABW19_dt0204270 [Dactylella cylindrospora]|nr:hypothetical protein ABW19_dt0204270 [Dactylella cylindrospora]